MLRINTLFIRSIVFFSFLTTGSISASDVNSEKNIIASSVEYFKSKMPQDHPRLLLKKSELPEFRAFIQQQLNDKNSAIRLRKIFLEHLDQPLIPEPRLLSHERSLVEAEANAFEREAYKQADEAGNTAWRLALQYLITNDETYGREAARWLMHIASWDIKDETGYKNNDEEFIQLLRPMIFAYDWAYSALTADERTFIQQAIKVRLDVLWQHLNRVFSLTYPTSPRDGLSHPLRFASTLGQGGQALFGEVADADQYLAWVYEYYLRQFPLWGGDDGGWSEGLDYWAGGLTQHLRFLDGLRLLGFDEPLRHSFFRNTGYFGVYFLLPYPASSFSDLASTIRPSPNYSLLIEKLALLNQDPELLAFAKVISNRYPYGFHYYTFNSIDTLLHQYRLSLSSRKLLTGHLSQLPQSRHFRDIGWVAMHSQIGSRDEDIMLGFKSSPFGSISHQFADQNSFVINAFGESLAISSGYREWYGSPHHRGWTSATHSKNAILIGGKGQTIKDPKNTGSIERFYDGSNFSFVTGNALNAYKTQAHRVLRSIFFVNRRYFVMLDQLEASEPNTFQWLIHAREKMLLDPERANLTIRKNNTHLSVHFLLPDLNRLQFSQTDQFAVPVHPDYSGRMPNEWHTTVSTDQLEQRTEFLSVLYPFRSIEAPAASKRLPSHIGHILQVGDDAHYQLILMSREGENRVKSEIIALEGYAASMNWQGSVLTGFTLVESTRLEQDELRIKASRPVTIEGILSERGLQLYVPKQASGDVKISLSVLPLNVTGPSVRGWHYDPNTQQLVLHLEK